MQNDVISLICRLTPSKPEIETLKNDILQSLKQALKADPNLNFPVFEFIQQRSKSPSSQVRLLLFQLVNYIFCRSAHFRSIFCRSYVLPFMSNFTTNLPPPERLANKLIDLVKISIPQWAKKFGHIYKQLNILVKQINPKISPEEKIKIDQASHINDLADIFILRYTIFFREMQNIIDLMDKDKSQFVMPSDEYQQIIIEQLKERKNELERCGNDISNLKMNMIMHHVENEVKDKVMNLYDKYIQIEEAARQIGAYDDDFEDAIFSDDENGNDDANFEQNDDD